MSSFNPRLCWRRVRNDDRFEQVLVLRGNWKAYCGYLQRIPELFGELLDAPVTALNVYKARRLWHGQELLGYDLANALAENDKTRSELQCTVLLDQLRKAECRATAERIEAIEMLHGIGDGIIDTEGRGMTCASLDGRPVTGTMLLETIHAELAKKLSEDLEDDEVAALAAGRLTIGELLNSTPAFILGPSIDDEGSGISVADEGDLFG